MNLPLEITPSLNWWISNIAHSFKKISHGQPALCIYTDASLEGWGAFDKTHAMKTGGEWVVHGWMDGWIFCL